MKSLPQVSARRAAIYCRVSTAVQEDGTSLSTQEAACRKQAGEQFLLLDDDQVYREVHTGTELWERPVLSRLRDAIRHRDIDIVVAFAIDRLSRDPVHLGVILSEADHAGVDVQFVTEPLDNSPEGQLIRFIRGYAAKVEHEKIKERSIRGKRAKAQAGKFLPGCRAPYGYRWVDTAKSALEPDPTTAPIVRRIFGDIAAGRTLRQIALTLTAEGTPTPSGKGKPRWSHQSVKWILQSPTYTGEPVAFRYTKTGATDRYGVAPVERHIPLPSGTVPALVSREISEAAQVRLQRNREVSARNNGAPEQTLLRGGYVRCGHCGGTLQVRRARSFTKQQADTYFCHTAQKQKSDCSSGASMSARILDPIVWAQVETVLTKPGVVKAELERLEISDPTAADLTALEKRLAEVERQQHNLVDQLAKVSGAVASLVTDKLASLEQQREQLALERQIVLGRRATWQRARERLADLEDWCGQVASQLGHLTYEQRRMALDALGVRVVVWQAVHSPRYRIEANIPLVESPESAVVSRTSRSSCPE